jgi:hypothetical protein
MKKTGFSEFQEKMAKMGIFLIIGYPEILKPNITVSFLGIYLVDRFKQDFMLVLGLFQ